MRSRYVLDVDADELGAEEMNRPRGSHYRRACFTGLSADTKLMILVVAWRPEQTPSGWTAPSVP